jgi:hypothetical protein
MNDETFRDHLRRVRGGNVLAAVGPSPEPRRLRGTGPEGGQP